MIQIPKTALNPDTLYAIMPIANTRNIQTEDQTEVPALPPLYEHTWLNPKFFKKDFPCLQLRSSIARILDVTDVEEYYMKEDFAEDIPYGQTVPTDSPHCGLLLLALDWLGVFKRRTTAKDKFMQLKAMFPKLKIFKKDKDIKTLVKKWQDAKSEMFKKMHINRLNFKKIIREKADKGENVNECILLDTLMKYLTPTITNIINGRRPNKRVVGF